MDSTSNRQVVKDLRKERYRSVMDTDDISHEIHVGEEMIALEGDVQKMPKTVKEVMDIMSLEGIDDVVLGLTSGGIQLTIGNYAVKVKAINEALKVMADIYHPTFELLPSVAMVLSKQPLGMTAKNIIPCMTNATPEGSDMPMLSYVWSFPEDGFSIVTFSDRIGSEVKSCTLDPM